MSRAIFDFGSYKLVYCGTYEVWVLVGKDFHQVGIGFTSFNDARKLAKEELKLC